MGRWETLSNYERGRSEAPLSVLVAISERFSVPIQALIPADTYSPQTSDTMHVVRECADRCYYLQAVGDRQRVDAVCDLAEVLDEIPPDILERLIDVLVRLVKNR